MRISATLRQLSGSYTHQTAVRSKQFQGIKRGVKSADEVFNTRSVQQSNPLFKETIKMASQSKDFSERRLEKATKHVSSLWFPINPQTLTSIREEFGSGTYDRDPERLLEDLKKDFALFTFLVKELSPIATAEQVSPSIVQNPAELIRWAGPTRIKSFIFNDAALPQSHLFNSLEPFQANRLRETAIVASTAEVLSESQKLDPNTGFCHGVIREIGLNLIAWNYPSLFSRVVQELTAEASLEERLAKELGFSPALLAMRVLAPNKSLLDYQSSKDPIIATYDKLCEIGEALARAENPELYPSAENDWKLANDYLQQTVGDTGVNLIRSRAMEHSEEYQRALTSLFKSLDDFNPEKRVAIHKKRATARKNRWLSQCSPEIQAALKNLYSEMQDARSARKVLESLLRTIIPQAGFTGGCVFVVDPAAMALMPRTVFGNVNLRPVERVALRSSLLQQDGPFSHEPITSGRVELDLAATALSCAQPVVERHDSPKHPALTGMYGSLGDNRRIGVLYLETPEAPTSSQEQQSMGTFKAMRQALADALHLD
jgi:hypothetical protein